MLSELGLIFSEIDNKLYVDQSYRDVAGTFDKIAFLLSIGFAILAPPTHFALTDLTPFRLYRPWAASAAVSSAARAQAVDVCKWGARHGQHVGGQFCCHPFACRCFATAEKGEPRSL